MFSDQYRKRRSAPESAAEQAKPVKAYILSKDQVAKMARNLTFRGKPVLVMGPDLSK
eukprot:gene18074-21529_t